MTDEHNVVLAYTATRLIDRLYSCLRGLQGRNMIAQGKAQRRPGFMGKGMKKP